MSLMWKLTVALVLIVMTPLVASYFMIDQIATHAASTYANEAADTVSAMDKALDAYRDLFETTKHLHAEIADRLSRRPSLINVDQPINLPGDGTRVVRVALGEGGRRGVGSDVASLGFLLGFIVGSL